MTGLIRAMIFFPTGRNIILKLCESLYLCRRLFIEVAR